LVLLSRDSDGTIIPPRTKKTHPIIVRHLTHPALIPSKAYTDWHRGARRLLLPILRADEQLRQILPLAFPMRLHAVFFRDRNVGDLFGFLDGLADFLNDDLRGKAERDREPDKPVKVIENDRWIHRISGETRLEKDAERPRIELRLEELR
jgi:hypothetical protein